MIDQSSNDELSHHKKNINIIVAKEPLGGNAVAVPGSILLTPLLIINQYLSSRWGFQGQ